MTSSSSAPVSRGRPRSDATERILSSAAARLAISGVAALTMHEVAEEAGVSKGLIHYHFHDKDTLLTRLVLWMGDGLVRRERAALGSSTPQSAIDDLWRWLEGELTRGHARALVELASWPSGRVAGATVEVRKLRRVASTASAERLFGLLALRPRVPSTLLGELLVTFQDGLAASAERNTGGDARAAFDVLWLALLGLAD